MTTKTIYVAEDGTEFNTRIKCEKYESENAEYFKIRHYAGKIVSYCESKIADPFDERLVNCKCPFNKNGTCVVNFPFLYQI